MQKFRNSFTSKQGVDYTRTFTGRIINVNFTNWTVDVRSQFDRHFFLGIQIGSPYLHFNNGEGISVFPDVGAMCVVTVPGDSAPPFVSSFIMPHEAVNTSSAQAPLGTTSTGDAPDNATNLTYAGGRPTPNSGDIFIRTRDNNFIYLHRGGVLQIGATELAQRIYLPLRNMIMDVSQNYTHTNVGGTMLWGIQEGQSTQLPSQWIHTFRVFAADQYADIRVVAGKVQSPLAEPSGDAGETLNLQQLGIGNDDKKNPIIYEVTVSPKGFVAESGNTADANTSKQQVFRFFFDRAGGTFLRAQASLLVSAKKKMFLHSTDTMTLKGEKDIFVTANKGFTLDGGDFANFKGKVIRMNGGTMPVARQGDMCRIMLPTAMVSGTLSGAPFTGVMTIVTPLFGTIISGNNGVLA